MASSLPYRQRQPLPPPPPEGTTSEPPQQTATTTTMMTPPSPASPPLSSLSVPAAGAEKFQQHGVDDKHVAPLLAPAVAPLPTPPITPVKPALAHAAGSRVASIDLERDATLPAAPPLFAGTLQMGALLGDGQWARVFCARDAAGAGQRVYAAKVPRPSKGGEPARVLRHEACVLAFLAAQPHAAEHIVPFYGLDESTGALVLEYAPATLESLIQAYPRGTPLARDPIVGTTPFLRLARSLVSSVAWMHAQGIIHGDIKPRNILAFSAEDVRLGDFSSARLVSDTDPRPGDTCTATYAAPELLRSFRSRSSSSTASGIPSRASDVWGMAATLLFAGTGEEPYSDVPHALGRLAEAARGTVWAHVRNGGNIGRVRQDGVLYKVLSGVLLREKEEARWSVLEWLAVVEKAAAEVGEEE